MATAATSLLWQRMQQPRGPVTPLPTRAYTTKVTKKRKTKEEKETFNPCVMFGSVVIVYYTLEDGLIRHHKIVMKKILFNPCVMFGSVGPIFNVCIVNGSHRPKHYTRVKNIIIIKL